VDAGLPVEVRAPGLRPGRGNEIVLPLLLEGDDREGVVAGVLLVLPPLHVLGDGVVGIGTRRRSGRGEGVEVGH
jgi:hypothetical protein